MLGQLRAAEESGELKSSPGVEVSSDEAGSEEVDDNKPTDFFHAVKPKPKAVIPLAEISEDGRELRARRAVIARRLVLGGALLAVTVLAIIAAPYLLPLDKRPPARPSASEQQQKQQPLQAMARAGRSSAEAQQDGPQRRAPTEAESSSSEATTASTAPSGVVRVGFERRGQAIIVPVRLSGAEGSVTAKMLFDTGATFSTLKRGLLRKLGAGIGTATTKTATANGVVNRRLSVIDGVSVGAAAVKGGLTVAVCEACAMGGTAGLLGLNFSRHFVVTIDHDAGELLLKPRRVQNPQLFDVKPFVSLSDARSERRGKQMRIRFTVVNRSPRPLRQVHVIAHIRDPGRIRRQRPQTVVDYVPARSKRLAVMTMPAPPKATTFTLEIQQASFASR